MAHSGSSSCGFLMLGSYFMLLNELLIHSQPQTLFWEAWLSMPALSNLGKRYECVFGAGWTDRCGTGWVFCALCAVHTTKRFQIRFYIAAMVQMSNMIGQERERELCYWSWLEANGAVWHFIFRHSSGTAPGMVCPFDWSVGPPLKFKQKYLNNWIYCHEIWPHWDEL